MRSRVWLVVLVFLIGMGGVSAINITGDVLYGYNFDEATGANLTDFVRNTYNLSVFNNPSNVTGKVGGAKLFSTANDYYNASVNSSLSSAPGYSMCAWVNRTTQSNQYELLWEEQTLANRNGFHVFISSQSNGQAYPIAGDGSASTNYISGTGLGAALPANTWHYVCFAMNTTNNTLVMYVNGTPYSSVTASPARTFTAGIKRTIGIGFRLDAFGNFSGMLDEMYVWNGTLTQEQVLTLYNNGTAGVSYPWGASGGGGGGGNTLTFRSMNITPYVAYTTSTLVGVCNVTSSNLTGYLNYNFSWFRNDTFNTSSVVSGLQGSNMSVSLGVGLTAGDVWKLQCFASDNSTSSEFTNTSRTILAPVSDPVFFFKDTGESCSGDPALQGWEEYDTVGGVNVSSGLHSIRYNSTFAYRGSCSIQANDSHPGRYVPRVGIPSKDGYTVETMIYDSLGVTQDSAFVLGGVPTWYAEAAIYSGDMSFYIVWDTSSTFSSSVARSSGWHKFQTYLSGTDCLMYVDDVNVKNGTCANGGSIPAVSSVQCKGICYMDDMAVYEGMPRSDIHDFIDDNSSGSGSFSTLLNPNDVSNGCSGSKNYTQCFYELVNYQANTTASNATRRVGSALTVPWFGSSTACSVSDLKSGSDCNIGSVTMLQYCVVSDEQSVVSINLAGGNNESLFHKAFEFIRLTNTSYGQIPSWKVLVNESAGTLLQCDSRTNSNCDTASDGTARYIIALFTASNNSLFTNQANKSAYYNLAVNLTRDMLLYEVTRQCYNSSLGSGLICYWPAGGSVVKSSGMGSSDYAYTAYSADIVEAFLMAYKETGNVTYAAVAGNVTLAYLQASLWNGSGFRAPPGKSYKWTNISGGGSLPNATCTNTCSPQQWDGVDAPRAFGMCDLPYYAGLAGVSLPNITQYCYDWDRQYLRIYNAVPLQYNQSGKVTASNQSGYFAQGLQSLALAGANATNYNKSLRDSLSHYSSGSNWDSTACFGVYNQGPIMRSLAMGIGANLNSYASGFAVVNYSLSFSLNDSVSGAVLGGWCVNASSSNGSSVGCTSGASLVLGANAGNYTILWFNVSAGNVSPRWFNVSLSGILVSGDASFVNSSYQSLLNVSASRVLSNASISTFNVSNNRVSNSTVSGSVLVKASNISNNILVGVLGNYSLNVSCAGGSPFTTVVCNATGVYDSVLTLGARSGSVAVTNYNLVVNTSLFGVIVSEVVSLNRSVPVLQGYIYGLNFSKGSFAVNTTSFSLANNSVWYNATLSPTNLNIVFRDELNRSVLNGTNVSAAIVFASGSEQVFSTTNGSLALLGALDLGSYIIRYSAPGYSLREYSFTLSSGDLNLTLYLIQSVDYAAGVVTVNNFDGLPVNGATVYLYRYYGDPSIPSTVQTGTTGSDGTTVLTAEAITAFYTFRVDVGGVMRINTTTPELLTLESDGLWYKTFTLGRNATENMSRYAGFNIVFSPASAGLVNGTIYDFSTNVSSTIWDVTGCSVYLVDLSDGSVLAGPSSGWCSSDGGDGSVTYETTQSTAHLRLVVNVSTDYFINSYYQDYGVYSYSNESVTLVTFVDDLSGFDKAGFGSWGKFLIAFLVICGVVYSVAGLGALSLESEGVLILITMMVVGFSYIGWLTVPLGLSPPNPVMDQWVLGILMGVLTLVALLRKWGAFE